MSIRPRYGFRTSSTLLRPLNVDDMAMLQEMTAINCLMNRDFANRDVGIKYPGSSLLHAPTLNTVLHQGTILCIHQPLTRRMTSKLSIEGELMRNTAPLMPNYRVMHLDQRRGLDLVDFLQQGTWATLWHNAVSSWDCHVRSISCNPPVYEMTTFSEKQHPVQWQLSCGLFFEQARPRVGDPGMWKLMCESCFFRLIG